MPWLEGLWSFFRLARYHWCLFGPLNLANLWKAVNRIRFKMGKFSRTQIRTLTSSSPKKKKKYFSNFWGVLYILPTCFISVLTNCQKKNWPIFGPLRARCWPNCGVIGGSQGFFGSNVPRALLIDPRKWLVDAPKWKTKPSQKMNHILAKIVMQKLRACACTRAIGLIFTISSVSCGTAEKIIKIRPAVAE